MLQGATERGRRSRSIIGRRSGPVESLAMVVEGVRYEGGSEEAEYVREGAKSGGVSSELHEELSRPPVAGRWVDGPAEDLSE